MAAAHQHSSGLCVYKYILYTCAAVYSRCWFFSFSSVLFCKHCQHGGDFAVHGCVYYLRLDLVKLVFQQQHTHWNCVILFEIFSSIVPHSLSSIELLSFETFFD